VALDWRKVSLPFVGGVDTKSADAALPMPKLARCENGVFTKRGQVRKRYGSQRLTTDAADGVNVTSAAGLFARDRELLLADGERLLSYSDSQDQWFDKGNLAPMAISARPVCEQASNQYASDYDEAGGVGVWAWEDSRGGVRYSVVDTETGEYLYSDQSLATDGRAPRVQTIGGFIHILYVDDSEGSLRTKVVQPQYLAGSLATASVEIITDIKDATAIAYDVVPYGETARLAYVTSASTTTKVYELSRSGAASNGVTLTVTATCLALGITPAGQIPRLVIVCGTAAGLSVAYADPDALSFSAFETAVLADVARVAISSSAVDVALEEGGDLDENESTFSIWVETSAASASNRIVRLYAFSSFNTFSGTVFHTIRHAALASGGFRHGRYGYAVLTYVNTSQPTYFVYRHDAVMCGVSLPRTAAGLPNGTHGPAVLPRPKLASDGWVFAGVEREALETEPTVNASGVVTGLNVSRTDYRLSRVLLEFDAPLSAVEVGRSLYLTGGCLWQYDGERVSESGFLLYPEGTTNSASNGSGSLTVSATYAYRIYYEWINAQGERERSGALPLVVTMGASDDTNTLTIPTLTHTGKTDVQIVVYRTEANPTFDASFYRVSGTDPATASGANRYVANDTTADTVSFEDGYADATIITKELDYQSGGELQNIAPPAPAIIGQDGDRVFLADAGATNAVRYSKLYQTGLGVAFTDEWDPISVDRAGGEITAVMPLNDQVIVFKRDRIYAANGDGPNNLGVGAYAPAREVTSDVGCIDQRSVVRMPDGLMFKSGKGIYLLDDGLRVSYVGADVEAYNAQDVTAAVLVSDANQVRFLTSDGVTLMYDYLFRQWSTWTNHEGAAACLWRGRDSAYCRADALGRVYVEDQTSHSDQGAAIPLVVETSWIKLGALQGYQSVRRMWLLGEYRSEHTVRVHVSRNYKDAPDYSFVWDPASVMNLTTWGSDAEWGDGAWGGEGSTVYQFPHHLRDMKCESVRFRFTDLPGIPAGESFVLTELLLEIGEKRGTFKSKAARTANTGG
jgi:hypothetical protein